VSRPRRSSSRTTCRPAEESGHQSEVAEITVSRYWHRIFRGIDVYLFSRSSPEVFPVESRRNRSGELLIGFDGGLGERVVASDEPDLKGVDVRCPHILNDPKNLSKPAIVLLAIEFRTSDVESPFPVLGGIEPECCHDRHVAVELSYQVRSGIDFFSHQWVRIHGSTPLT
jgi:hypothetical protein